MESLQDFREEWAKSNKNTKLKIWDFPRFTQLQNRLLRISKAIKNSEIAYAWAYYRPSFIFDYGLSGRLG